MLFSIIIKDYFRWHYTRAFNEMAHVLFNFLWFFTNLFSLPQLTTSLFSPWRRITEEKQKGFDFENVASFLIINLLSRIVGAVMRSIIIIVGLLTLMATITVGVFTFVFWVLAPACIVSLIGGGITLIITTTII
jgi:hypothetical protein